MSLTHSPLGAVISFKHSDYTVRESAGRVAVTIEAAKSSYYTRNSCYVKIRASVNKSLRPYGNYTIHVSVYCNMKQMSIYSLYNLHFICDFI